MSSREVRLGLVLYGGVSLAIYENGIVQEIYRAMCRESVYELISELIDSDIVVDVISGTSAGGVNGVMLAYSLARGLDFLPSADLWREQGDIEKLMRKPEDGDDASLLDSKFYQERLASCYGDTLKPPANKTPPTIAELDLFVTGTDANGVISTVFDDLGHPIDVKNHRAVFQLQYRGARKNDFLRGATETTPEQMATLSRLTSGFPVAFEPIHLGTDTDDPNFYRWGKLSGPAVYMDGGILNNKPFTSTIQAITSRTATREVERFLIYVEPSPEQFTRATGSPETPTILQAGVRSLTSIPSYQSIAADLQAIEAHNERALQAQKILEGLGDAPESGIDCLQRTTVLPADDDPCGRGAYLTARLLLVKNAAVEAILNSPDGQRDFFRATEISTHGNAEASQSAEEVPNARRSGRLLVQSFWFWQGDERKTLVEYDVFFRRRRIDHLTRVLMGALKSDDKPIDVPPVAWEAVNHFFKLYEITEWAMRKWMTQWPSQWRNLSLEYPDLDSLDAKTRNQKLTEISGRIWGEAEQVLDRFMACDVAAPAFEFRSSDDLSDDRQRYYDELQAWIRKPAPTAGPNLLISLDNRLAEAIVVLEDNPDTAEVGQLLRREFCRFIDVDRQLLPMQIGSDFESTNVIRVVRFSPLDAQRALSRGQVQEKVRGTALANFGAFFKKGWRANDIMMGRFDAACLLTECLLTKERLTLISAKYRNEGKVFTVSPDLVSRALPAADAGLATKINSYFADPQPTPTMWEDLIDSIVQAAHKQIEAEEWPRVLQCTLEQQYQWGQYQEAPAMPEGLVFPSKWTAAKSSPDELLVQVAANAIKQGNLPPRNPVLSGQTRGFLDEVPLTAMQEHASLAMVRLGRSLLASVPEGRARNAVGENLIFRITMQWIPGFFYRLVYTRRTQPDWILLPLAVILNLALIAVLLFAWLTERGHHLSLIYALCATVGVAAAGAIQWTLTRKRPLFITIGIVVGIVLAVAYLRYGGLRRPSHAETVYAAKCAASVLVIALTAMLPFKGVLARFVTAALAGLILLKFIWI